MGSCNRNATGRRKGRDGSGGGDYRDMDNQYGRLTAMAIHALSNGNGHTVGEKTWGATGPLTDNEILNGGQFTAANFLFAYTSASMFKYIDGKIYEGNGFPPDYNVAFNLNAFHTIGDTQLEKALSLMP